MPCRTSIFRPLGLQFDAGSVRRNFGSGTGPAEGAGPDRKICSRPYLHGGYERAPPERSRPIGFICPLLA